MKYYRKELWREINSLDESTRTWAEQRWAMADVEYSNYFNKIKKYLPKSFVNIFNNHSGFHDYTINCISITSGEKNNCEFVLTSSPYTIHLVLYDVSKVQCDISGFSSCICGKLHWGYLEIEILSSRQIEVRILFDLENEMRIDCRKISCNVEMNK